MFEKIIRKYNINTRGMVINGSVALIIVVIIAKFLGEKNIRLGWRA